MDTLAKLYDAMILNRLKLWWNIHKCQASSQKGRSCVEQISALGLLCDYVQVHTREQNCMLTLASRVPRRKLIECLMNYLGCGKVMTKAIIAIYSRTNNVMKFAVMESIIYWCSPRCPDQLPFVHKNDEEK